MFAYRLRKAMDEKDMNQLELSIATGISRASISQYVSGKYEPKKENVEIIAKVLDVTPAYLLGFDEKPDENKFKTNDIKEIDIQKGVNSLSKLIEKATAKAVQEVLKETKLEEDEPLMVVAAHHKDYDFSQKQLEQIDNFINFVKEQEKKEPPQ